MRKQRWITKIAALLAVTLIALVGTAATAFAGEANHPSFYIEVDSTAGEINFRSGAGTDCPVIFTIPNGTVLTILDIFYNSDDTYLWGRSRFLGRDGWVSLRQTRILKDGDYPALDFNAEIDSDTGSANFRNGSGTTAAVIGEIPNGTMLNFKELTYNPEDGLFWGYTSYNGQNGWVSIRQTGIMKGHAGIDDVILESGSSRGNEFIAESGGDRSEAAEENAEREDGLFLKYNWLDSYQYENTETTMTANGPEYSYLEGRVTFLAASADEPKKDSGVGFPVGPKWAVITGYDEDGTQTWQVVTEQVFVLNGGYSCLGVSEELVYYTDYHNLYALDLDTGEQVWVNSDVGQVGASDGGYHGSAVGKEGEIYISATNGAGFLAVDADGNTIFLAKGNLNGNYIQRAEVAEVWYLGDESQVLLQNAEGVQVEHRFSR